MTTAIIDANVLLGLLDERDKWHSVALAIRDTLIEHGIQLLYFDCVINEVISVLARRTYEQRRSEQFDALLSRLRESIPSEDITWVSGEIQRLYDPILDLIRDSEGKLNFHDALIALVSREWNVTLLISFDQDFDQIGWLVRVGDAVELEKALQ